MQNWVVFRFPNSNDFYFITHENKGNQFVSFHSFQLQEHCCFQSEKIEILSEDEILKLSIQDLKPNICPVDFPDKKTYSQRIEKAKRFVIEQNLKKIVISRPKLIEFEYLNLRHSYLQLSRSYPNTFCYLMQYNQQTWMGATPELLGSFDSIHQNFECMSLAGTLELACDWTQKELQEQKAVSESISETLHRFSDLIEISETKDHLSGNIKHLRTDFKAKIKAMDLEKLISELHPTPAVCGFPKEKCLPFILENEHYSRKFYTGYIRIATPQNKSYYVNLRCAEFYKNEAHLYVGGGITPYSNAEQEWEETELKSEAIANHLVFH